MFGLVHGISFEENGVNEWVSTVVTKLSELETLRTFRMKMVPISPLCQFPTPTARQRRKALEIGGRGGGT